MRSWIRFGGRWLVTLAFMASTACGDGDPEAGTSSASGGGGAGGEAATGAGGAAGAGGDGATTTTGAGGGASGECAESPYAGTCLDGLFTGFDATGACAVDGKTGFMTTLTWDNGAKVQFIKDNDGSGFDAGVRASDSALCGSLKAGGADGTEVSWLPPDSVEVYKSVRLEDGSREYTCPGGSKFTLGAAQVLDGIGCIFSSTAGRCDLANEDINNAF